MKIQANNFTIFWNGAAIAYATTAELDVNADTIETGSATSGKWRTYKRGRMGWTISAGHLFDVDVQQRNILSLLKAGSEVNVAFGTIDDHVNKPANEQQLNYDTVYNGKVIINRFTVSAVKGQFVTCQFNAVGCGELSESRGTQTGYFFGADGKALAGADTKYLAGSDQQ